MGRSVAKGIVALLVAFAVAGCGGSAATPTGPGAAATTAAPVAALPTGSGACGEPVTGTGGFSSVDCTVQAPSLANNKLGDAAELAVTVMLPDGYAASTTRYPTIYMLGGYTEPLNIVFGSFTAALAGKTAAPNPQVIVVMVSGTNALGGGFYVNSPVTGNWDDAIARDLVGYVDGHYRTINAAKSRGIAGHSMGGSGALSLAMHHPELFGAVYALSPGLFDTDGADARLGQSGIVSSVLDIAKSLGSGAPDAEKIVGRALSGGEDLEFEFAYGMAFAPDPSAPMLMKFPYSGDPASPKRDAETWKLWEAGFGALPDKLQKYGAALKGMAGVGLDWGKQDEYAWIPAGCAYFVSLLQEAKITVTSEAYEGTHSGQLGDRMVNHMLPFMLEKLAKS